MLDFLNIKFLLGQNFLADPTEVCVPQLWTFYAWEREAVSLGGDIPLGVNEPAWGSPGSAECLGLGPRGSRQPCRAHAQSCLGVFREHLSLEEGP